MPRSASLTYRVQEQFFVLELALGGRHLAVASPDLPTLEPLLLRLVPGLTLLNNIVSYPDAIGMLELTHRVAGDGALEVPLHDYFAICPSLNLLDDQSRYCGVPELSRCRTCLAQVALPLPGQQATRDIDGWRAAWATVLRRADRIVGFSRSSRELLARAYPGLDPARIELRPHRVDYLPSRPVALDFAADLHIGVVGEISVAKGAAIVAAIDRHLRDDRIRDPPQRHRHARQAPALRRAGDRSLSRRRPAATDRRARDQRLPDPVDLARDVLLCRRGAARPRDAGGRVRSRRAG